MEITFKPVEDYKLGEEILATNSKIIKTMEAQGQDFLTTLSRKELSKTISYTYAAIESLQIALEYRKAELMREQRDNTLKIDSITKNTSN